MPKWLYNAGCCGQYLSYSYLLLASERSDQDTIRGNKWKSEMYICIYKVSYRGGLALGSPLPPEFRELNTNENEWYYDLQYIS